MKPDLRNLPPTLPVWSDDPEEPSLRWFFPSLSRGLLYAAVRSGETIPSIRLGRRVLVPTQALLRLLEGERPNGDGPGSSLLPEPGLAGEER